MVKLKKLKVNIITSLVSLLLIFLVLEIGFRIYFNYNYNEKHFADDNLDNDLHPQLIDRNIRPYGKLYNYNSYAELNSYGFRDYEYNKTKPNNTIRIAVIGDSTTFGFGIENTSDTYPKVLETLLNNNSNQKYEVMNFGMAGANILDIYWILKYKVLKYNPDIVIYGYFENDPEFLKDNLDVNYCSIFNENINSFLLMYIDIKIDNLKTKIMSNFYNTHNMYGKLVDTKYYGWECFDSITNEITKVSANNQFKVFIFTLPSLDYRNDIDLFIEKEVYEIINKNNLEIYPNFATSFWNKTKGYSRNELRIDPENGELHYNERATRFIAEIIYSYFKENNQSNTQSIYN